jgi:hypothetical protein
VRGKSLSEREVSEQGIHSVLDPAFPLPDSMDKRAAGLQKNRHAYPFVAQEEQSHATNTVCTLRLPM